MNYLVICGTNRYTFLWTSRLLLNKIKKNFFKKGNLKSVQTNLQIDFDFYILWQLNNASFVQMCCCGCKVIFYNSIIHVSTFGFSKPPTLNKVQQHMKRTKTFQLSCNFHGQWLWFALKKSAWKMHLKSRSAWIVPEPDQSSLRFPQKKIWFMRSWMSISFCLWGQHFNNS